MGHFKYVDGDLIKFALEGRFDVIAHGCNCMCNMGAGIAVGMRKTFNAHSFPLERTTDEDDIPTANRGDINKLGQIDYQAFFTGYDKNTKTQRALSYETYSITARKEGTLKDSWIMAKENLIVVNAYTQYNYGRNHEDGDTAPVDLSAIVMCMKKINHIFKGKHIGLPKIGSGLGGGSWETIEQLIKTQLKDCDVTIVNYVP